MTAWARPRYLGGNVSPRSLRPLAALLLCGCLTQTHLVPRQELFRLASIPPQERGREVRVVQGFVGSEAPPERVNAGIGVGVVMPRPFSYGYGYGYGGGHYRPSVQMKKDQAKWWLIVAGLTAFGLAVTEGIRYDGWVEVAPTHPLHLYGPSGEWSWMPLSELTPEAASWASRGFVRSGEGPWREVGRAPLDRAGFTFSLLMGSGQVEAFDGYDKPGFLSHVQLGAFLSQSLGVAIDWAVGWRTDRDFTDIFQSRHAIELQWLPLSARPFHAGGYGQVGFAWRFEDFPDGTGTDRFSLLAGGGGILQLELTTRLALTVRGGVAWLVGDRAAEITAGLSIY